MFFFDIIHFYCRLNSIWKFFSSARIFFCSKPEVRLAWARTSAALGSDDLAARTVSVSGSRSSSSSWQTSEYLSLPFANAVESLSDSADQWIVNLKSNRQALRFAVIAIDASPLKSDTSVTRMAKLPSDNSTITVIALSRVVKFSLDQVERSFSSKVPWWGIFVILLERVGRWRLVKACAVIRC